MLFNYQWDSNYDELISFYPKFYYDVLEMQAVLKAEGAALDAFMENTDRVFYNCFIDTMDETTVSRLEDFLNIKLYKQRTLEERKRLLKSFFIGHGRLSADLIKQMVSAYTGSDVEVYLEPITRTLGYAYYEPGDNRLYINYLRGTEPMFYLNDIDTLLSRLIPAHLDYRSALTYRFGVQVAPGRRNYLTDFRFCGTEPEFSTLGLTVLGGVEVNASSGLAGRVRVCMTYKFCGTVVCHDGP